jgi:peptidyl-prolyl cis-trans isomerase A (cyclophilin A)
MRKKLLLLIPCLLAHQAAHSVGQPEFVELQTNLGTIALQLDYTHAPITATNFITYVQSGFYKQTLMHRVIKGFVIQGGGYSKTDGALKTTRPAIALESNKGLGNFTGTIAMARTNDFNSATSQFFINVADNVAGNLNNLDYQNASNPGYAVFGKVIHGMGVVTKIENLKTYNQFPFTGATYNQFPFTGATTSVVFIETAYASATFPANVSKTRIMLSGSGTVTSTPNGISCGPTCLLSQTAGAALTLTATPKAGSVFSGWRGDCQGLNPNLTINTLKGNHNCTAMFSAVSTAAQ